jgi:thiol-disulfide isomerase/thioredoxin
LIELESLDSLKEKINKEELVLAYFTGPNCGVCTALKPKVEEMLGELGAIPAYSLNTRELPESASEYCIFTIPAILVFVQGKEQIREARYISVIELKAKLERLQGLLAN